MSNTNELQNVIQDKIDYINMIVKQQISPLMSNGLACDVKYTGKQNNPLLMFDITVRIKDDSNKIGFHPIAFLDAMEAIKRVYALFTTMYRTTFSVNTCKFTTNTNGITLSFLI